MMERIETILTLVASLIGAISALLAVMVQLQKLFHQAREQSRDAEMAKDILRLEEVVQSNQEAIQQLKAKKVKNRNGAQS